MNISNQIELKEMTEFNARNVSQKEIYDSYMGILRISPNKIQGKNVDDPTPLLNTLVDFKGIHEGIGRNKEVKVTLSDSDGNELPIKFIPKVFTTQVMINEFNGKENRGIINMSTEVQGYTYVSNKLTVRSTLILSNPVAKKSQLTFILGCPSSNNSNTIECEEILSYPIEAPNDDSFFNNKNKFNLFNPAITEVSRALQMEENLANWTREEYANTGLLYSDHHVKINGQFVDTISKNNQYIPILYNKDYVLGSYEGHTVTKRNDNWIPDTGTENVIIKDGKQTRLSWLRFDNLIWEALEEILQGKVRHTAGRYNGLGKSGNDDICDTLFGGSYSEVIDDLRQKGPILGQGVQDGIVSYTAMPLKRYWFHRCRQVVSNLEYWQNLVEKSPNKPNWEWFNTSGFSWGNYSQITGDNIKYNKKELDYLQSAFTNGLITAASDAVVAPQHTLSRHFIICDGSEINFINYPNISLKNHKIFKVESKGMKAIINEETGFFDVYTTEQRNGVHRYIESTPELYVFNERYPRFIRALNWMVKDDWNTEDIKNPTPTSPADYPNILNSENSSFAYIHTSTVNQFPYEETGWNDKYSRDAFGKLGIDIPKNIKDCKLHSYTFEYLTQTIPHTHKMFSSIQGGRGTQDFSKTEIEFTFRAAHHAFRDASKCLWENLVNPFALRTIEWLGYSFDDNKLFFDNYTPVPNAGLLVFNSENFNQYNSIGRMDSQYTLQRADFIQIAMTFFANILYSKQAKIMKKKKDDANFNWTEQFKARLDAFLQSEDAIYKPSDTVDNKGQHSYPSYSAYESWYNKRLEVLEPGQTLVKLDEIWWDEKIFPNESHKSKSSVTGKSIKYYTNYRTYTFAQYYIDYYRDGEVTYSWKKAKEDTAKMINAAFNEQYPYRGTIPAFEKINWKDVEWSYYDNKFEKHPINANITIKPLSESSKNLLNGKGAWNDDEVKALSKELYEHQSAKAIRKQVAVKMNEAESKIPISYYGKAQFSNRSENIHWWKKKRNWLKIIFFTLLLGLTGFLIFGLPELLVNYSGANARFLASEVASVVGQANLKGASLAALAGQLTSVANNISFYGSAWSGFNSSTLGLGVTSYGIKKSSFKTYWGSRWVAAKGYTGRKNIGSYKFGAFDATKYNPYEFQGQDSYTWQCLTSLPYTDTENLGCGDIMKLKPQTFKHYTNALPEDGDDYYVFHNVTDRWGVYSKEIEVGKNEEGEPIYERVSFNRNKNDIQLSFCKDEANDETVSPYLTTANDSPYPSHLNLIPIIKI